MGKQKTAGFGSIVVRRLTPTRPPGGIPGERVTAPADPIMCRPPPLLTRLGTRHSSLDATYRTGEDAFWS